MISRFQINIDKSMPQSARKILPVSPALLFLLLVSAGNLSLAGDQGDDINLNRYDRFIIAGQPDEAALESVRQEGVSLVINLRGASESDWDEKSASESLGLSYYHVPVDGSAATLAEGPFERISKIAMENPEARILVHCASGNRAAAWLAVYLSEVEGLPAGEAIEVAKTSGLTSTALEDKVRAYLEP